MTIRTFHDFCTFSHEEENAAERSPDAIENIAIWVNPQHDVLHGGVMNERAL